MKNIFRLGKKRWKVLIIDDEPDVTRFLQNILERSGGFEVWAANDPLEGIEIAKVKQPDAVLLDLVMPKMDGTDVAEKLQAQDTRDIPVIFFSALAAPEDVQNTRSTVAGRPVIPKALPAQEIISRLWPA